jgi:hypothetical protein
VNPWLIGALAAVGLGLYGWMCWRITTRLADDRTARPGDDAQFAKWLNNQELADRAERQGRDG